MYETQKEKLTQAVDYLQQFNIDAWVIYTSEGSDPCIPLITGVGTVGPGAFIITKKGEKLAICNTIDAQDIEQSELFDEVIHYTGDLRSEEHTSELQSRGHLVCRLLLE